MNGITFFKSKIRAKILNWYTAGELYVAAITKDPTKIGDFNKWTKRSATRLIALSIQNWQAAVISATNPDNPNRNPLYTMYERALYDDTVPAAMENRISRVKQSKFRWISESNSEEENEALTKAFKQMWFYDLMDYAMQSRFWGHSLVQVTEVDKKGGIKSVELVNRKHVKPDKHIVVKEESDINGEQYDVPPYSNWTFEFGKSDQLGILCKVIPFVALKGMNLGAWSIYVEKYGMPIRTVITDSTDKNRLDQLAAMMSDMGVDLWAVLQGTEKIEMVVPPQGSEGSQTYDKFWSRLDNAISRIILGNDATISSKDNKGTYASISAMAELQEYRHWDDKTFIQHVVNSNKEKFAMFGYRLDGYTFEWDDFQEMEVSEIIDAIPKIAPHAELDWEEIAKKTGIPILGPKQQATQAPDNPLGK